MSRLYVWGVPVTPVRHLNSPHDAFDGVMDVPSSVQMAASASGNLGVEERNLLSVAFKNVVGACRASWRALNAYEDSREVQDNKQLQEMYAISCLVARRDGTHT